MASQKPTLNLNTYMIYLSTLLFMTRGELISAANEEPAQKSSDIITGFKFMQHQSRYVRLTKRQDSDGYKSYLLQKGTLSNNHSLPFLAS